VAGSFLAFPATLALGFNRRVDGVLYPVYPLCSDTQPTKRLFLGIGFGHLRIVVIEGGTI
jgi:hypothetical protein